MSDRERKLEQLKHLFKTFTDPLVGTETIYHYTSADGLRGIVGSNELWLSNTAFVNDITECKALISEKELFDKKDFSNPQVKEKWFNYLKFDTNRNNYYYIVSFSTTKDFLGQWRSYGSYSIGFETNKLAKSKFNLYECVYNKKKIKDWILKKEKAGEWKGDCLDEKAKRLAAFVLIYAASMKYKNVNYEAEGEVRLITASNHSWYYSDSPEMYERQSPIHFRDHSVYKAPLPYVKFFLSNDKQEEDELIATEQKETEEQLKRKRLEQEMNQKRELLPIKEIRIGPMVHQKEAKLACEILLSEKGYKDVKVILSEIPYRGF